MQHSKTSNSSRLLSVSVAIDGAASYVTELGEEDSYAELT
jgi:hypothetical protein